MVEDSVQQGAGEGGIVVEDRGPVFESLVGGQHDGTTFVTLADDLKEQVGAVLVDGQVAEFVDDEESWLEIAGEFALATRCLQRRSAAGSPAFTSRRY